jgi:hypothetical protein
MQRGSNHYVSQLTVVPTHDTIHPSLTQKPLCFLLLWTDLLRTGAGGITLTLSPFQTAYGYTDA